MKVSTKLLGGAAVIVTLAGAMYAFTASSGEMHGGFGHHAMRPGMGRMMGHGMMGPGMMGGSSGDATTNQVQDIHRLLGNHDRIKRAVTNIADGIRTVTESDDPEVASLIKTHVADMMRRVEAGDNRDLPMQSPALREIFRNKDKVRTTVETTATGVIVVQTSNDAAMVATLQKHAGEVTNLVQGGMAAMHTAMMRNAGGAAHDGMMRGGMMDHGMGRHGAAGRDHDSR